MGIVESVAFQPPDRSWAQDKFRDPDVKKLKRTTINSAGEEICMLWFNQHKTMTILYSHGNAEDIGLSFEGLRELAAQADANLLAYDYCGYGLSSGTASESMSYCDIQAAYNWLVNEENVPRERIILFGRSLGSGPTTHLASITDEAAGLILQSPLSTAIRVVLPALSRPLAFMDVYKNKNKIAKVTNYPSLIIHGKVDQVVPWANGLELYQILQDEGAQVDCLWLDGCGHNDIEFNEREQFYGRIRDFVASLS